MFEENQKRLAPNVCQNTKLFVIPSPKHMEIDEADVMEIEAGDWSIVCLSDELETEARFLSDALNIKSTICASDIGAQPTTNTIYLQVQTNEEFANNSVHDKSSSMNAVNTALSNAATNEATNASTNTSMNAETNAATNDGTKTVKSYKHTNGQPMTSPINSTVSTQSTPEHYHLATNPSTRTIHITAPSNCGVFYGIQTLLSLLHNETSLPRVTITDEPRYTYRGMHIDVARNFHSETEILRLIDAMAMYKLNYLHLHLCDDEGWRIEIPGLAELTSVCSKRGHDPSEKTCLMPYLGSGPSITNSSGTGYYSTADYQEILRYATQRHVHVIPEIDLPGHAHAAINAMQVRYERLVREGKTQEAEEYLLLDRSTISDDINVASVHNFHCNAVDPTLDSTYNFIDKVISTLVSYHADICPLEVFHIGGDEVPYSAWGTYGSCRKLYEEDQITSFMDLMETFITRASQIVDKHHLTLGVWQDGLLVSTKRGIIPREKIVPQDCWSYAWRNNYDMAHGDCAVSLANAGYKVIQCEGSHLYFDHPQSPHPEDSGLYWAARYIDTHKTFSLTPDDLIGCHDVTQCGAEVTDEDRQDTREMWSTLDNPHNVIDMEKTERESTKQADWSRFSACVGTKELQRLDKLGIHYHLPIPGAIKKDGHLHMNGTFINQPLEYSMDGGETWVTYTGPVATETTGIIVRTSSADHKRHSTQSTITPTQQTIVIHCHPIRDQQIQTTPLNYHVTPVTHHSKNHLPTPIMHHQTPLTPEIHPYTSLAYQLPPYCRTLYQTPQNFPANVNASPASSSGISSRDSLSSESRDYPSSEDGEGQPSRPHSPDSLITSTTEEEILDVVNDDDDTFVPSSAYLVRSLVNNNTDKSADSDLTASYPVDLSGSFRAQSYSSRTTPDLSDSHCTTPELDRSSQTKRTLSDAFDDASDEQTTEMTSPGGEETNKKARTNYSKLQIEAFMAEFQENPYPDSERVEEMSRDLAVPESKIKGFPGTPFQAGTPTQAGTPRTPTFPGTVLPHYPVMYPAMFPHPAAAFAQQAAMLRHAYYPFPASPFQLASPMTSHPALRSRLPSMPTNC